MTTSRSKHSALVYILILGFFGLFLGYFTLIGPSTPDGDFWRHFSIVASFDRSMTSPEHESLAHAKLYRELHTPYHLLVAGFSKLAKIPPYEALHDFALPNLALFLISAYLLFHCHTKSRKQALLCTLVFLLLSLFLVLDSRPYASADASFLALHYTPPLPGFMAIGLLFFIYFLTHKLLHETKNWLAIPLAFALGFIFLTHALTAACAFLQVVVQSGFYLTRTPKQSSKWIAITLSLSGGFLLTLAWPYYQPIRWASQVVSNDPFILASYSHTLRQVALPTLFSIPILYLALRDPNDRMLCAMVFFCALVYCLSYLLHFYLFERFSHFYVHYQLLLLALFISKILTPAKLKAKGKVILRVTAFCALLFCIFSPNNARVLAWSGRIFYKTLVGHHSYPQIIRSRMAMLQHDIKPDDILLFYPPSSTEPYQIAAFTGAKFVFTRFTYTHPEYPQRLAEVSAFFTTDSEKERAEILQKYEVSGILLAKKDLGSTQIPQNFLESLGKPTDESTTYLYYRIR